MKSFWEKQHFEKNINALSGHPGQTVLNGLYLYKLPKDNARVLEIGVGLGFCTSDLVAMGAKVDALDISENALSRVVDVIGMGYLESALAEIPSDTYDLVVSYCVAQHMSNVGLKEQLKHVIRSLRSDGVFAMQYAIPYHTDKIHSSKEALESGSVCRTIESMNDFILEAGGKVVYHRIWGFFPQYNSGWAVVRVMRV